ncbi:hypothetical protein FUA48_11480 [Flavobacterium alkalisoli]|uniref:Uncharacterized protein n=1 Tax=Flavobacterium alkalisoli TaxID=2602769 RepID=A0A5B9FVZ1_9FLAO|nr:hypothetical protein [Flavobacterium alkalisoli]QEE50176.1 hypothetical protein FUA48_11480 [Flavobacterium alkalisoli]
MRTFIIFPLLILFTCSKGLCQDEKKTRLYVYYDSQSEYADNYKISSDSLTANFSIYYKEYIDGNNRAKALKEYENKVKKQKEENRNINYTKIITPIKRPIFSKWFTCYDPPVRLKEKELPDYITLEEYITNELRFKDMIFIIFKINDNEYMIWQGNHLRAK